MAFSLGLTSYLGLCSRQVRQRYNASCLTSKIWSCWVFPREVSLAIIIPSFAFASFYLKLVTQAQRLPMVYLRIICGVRACLTFSICVIEAEPSFQRIYPNPFLTLGTGCRQAVSTVFLLTNHLVPGPESSSVPRIVNTTDRAVWVCIALLSMLSVLFSLPSPCLWSGCLHMLLTMNPFENQVIWMTVRKQHIPRGLI